MSSSSYDNTNQVSSSGLTGDSESTPVHSGHVSAGSQLVSEGQQFTGVDMAAETAKFDNAYGAAPTHDPSHHSGSQTMGSGLTGQTSHSSHTGGLSSGQTGEYSSGTTGYAGNDSGYSGNDSSFQQSTGGAYQGSTDHQHSSHGDHHQHHSSHTGHSGEEGSYTGNKSEQKEQMKEEKKEQANEKKEELKDRNNKGESKMDIAKDEHNKIAKDADKETPEGHKPSLMDKVKTAVKKL